MVRIFQQSSIALLYAIDPQNRAEHKKNLYSYFLRAIKYSACRRCQAVPGFPDCEAKIEVEPGRWQHFRIEFEYESLQFKKLGHDPSQCDLIVCWRHNWKTCPPHIQVLELSKLVAQLAKR
jgi:hypothetical protein